jgi:glycerol-3-phosphate O-acyltransferase/dihydroxyacetone phosphate acyltransferase
LRLSYPYTEAFPQVAQAARRLYNTPGQHLSLGQVVELNKRFLEGYSHFKNETRIVALRENVLKYNRLLRDLGIRDHQVWDKRPLFSLFLLAHAFVGSTCAERSLEDPRSTSLSLGFAHVMDCSCSSRRSHQRTDLSGCFYHIKAQSERFVVVIPSVHSNRPSHAEALAASNVKIQARDVVATWKILISLGFAPVLYGFYAFVATVVATKAGASLQWRILTPLVLLATLPFIGFAALKFGEAGMDVLK